MLDYHSVSTLVVFAIWNICFGYMLHAVLTTARTNRATSSYRQAGNRPHAAHRGRQ